MPNFNQKIIFNKQNREKKPNVQISNNEEII